MNTGYGKFPQLHNLEDMAMRKLINKKGFSLVELMIVVVIMGILIAVAVPLYNAVTKNAEKRTCQDNQRTIRAVYARYVLDDHGNKTNPIFKPGHNSFNGATDNPEAVFEEEFLNGFDGHEFPECPIDGAYYTITFDADVDIVIACSAEGH